MNINILQTYLLKISLQRKWVHPFTRRGYIQPIVREVKDLTDKPSDSKDFKSATKFVSYCLENLERGEFVFKGKGIRVKVNPPERATTQWSD